MRWSPRGADVELIERVNDADMPVVIPNAARINGVPTLLAADAPFVVHEVNSGEAITVTFTVIVRSLTITAEAKGDAA